MPKGIPQGKRPGGHNYPNTRNGKAPIWPDERVDELKRLLAAKIGPTAIGRVMGLTRNAVIGKMHRLGLTNPGHRNKPPRKETRVRLADGSLPPAVVVPEAREDEPKPLSGVDGKPFTIATVPVTGCRYLPGEPVGVVCGHKVAGTIGTIPGSYCRWHLSERVFSKRPPEAA